MTNPMQSDSHSRSYYQAPSRRLVRFCAQPRRLLTCLLILLVGVLQPVAEVAACPFCSAMAPTLRQEMETMDAVVIATAMQSDATRDIEAGEASMRIEKILIGDSAVKVDQVVQAIYYGECKVGRKYMLSGVDPPNLQWSCLPLTTRGEAYIAKVAELYEAEPIKRLSFYIDYLRDDESMLAQDAYDEFALAPYEVVQALEEQLDHDQLVKWIREPDLQTSEKRLFLTLLGICGDEKDLPFLEEMLRSTKKSTRGGLDALVACYLTLSGEAGLPLVDELFLANADAPYADTYSAIMAIRFHGTESNVIPRSALVESLHHVLDRKELADLVIPDLARWNDWSQIDRLTDLFVKSDPENNWVRVPVINYLRACPLDKAEEAIEELQKIDPESVKRANTFFSIPKVAPEQPSSSDGTRFEPDANESLGLGFIVDPMTFHTDRSARGKVLGADRFKGASAKLAELRASTPGPVAGLQSPTAAIRNPVVADLLPVRPDLPNVSIPGTSQTPVAASVSGIAIATNPWRFLSVLLTATITMMIVPFLLLTGGPVPSK